MLKKVMLYLGLGPDEAYEEFDTGEPVPRGPLSSSEFVEARSATDDVNRSLWAVDDASTTVRALAPEQTGTVKRIPPPVASRPHTISPSSFEEVQEMADRFVAEQPVIVNLQGVESDLSRRIIDFASGVCYGVGGEMEKVANQVYLLTPTNVEVSAEDRRLLESTEQPD
ncbi:MAG: cell division protein SepF [Acidimicrobiales bacterium]|jgi:cell division inhibitor SepF|nr:cell division protein SepF [Acidimicrobiales bacterium]|tara:strand:+ start:42 stop:548 length:507 start_codon:yes stop_codon:yes gene_type:complete